MGGNVRSEMMFAGMFVCVFYVDFLPRDDCNALYTGLQSVTRSQAIARIADRTA